MRYVSLGTIVLLLTLLAASVHAGIGVQVGAGAGYAEFDDTYRVTNAIPVEARAGLTFWNYLGVEGVYGWVLGDSETNPEESTPVRHLGADVLINLAPRAAVNPYLVGGWARLDRVDPERTDEMSGFEFGAGFKIALARKGGTRLDLRLDARDVMVKNAPSLEDPNQTKHNLFFTAGFQLGLFGDQPDADGDGVPDDKDACPDTAPDVKVDRRGCAKDTDFDGVPDGLDACPDTPAGAVVDPAGCPLDSDRDGVPDGIDRCELTPAGVVVDADGCPVPTSDMEEGFVTTGLLRLDTIHFETGSATLQSDSFPVLHEVAAILLRWPSLKIEITGHTDATGTAEFNLQLSERRAAAVRDWLVTRYTELAPERFTVKGYGASQPVVDNQTAEGRAENRRVEFKVQNPEQLPD